MKGKKILIIKKPIKTIKKTSEKTEEVKTERFEKTLQKLNLRLKKKNLWLMEAIKKQKDLMSHQMPTQNKDLKYMAETLEYENQSLKKELEHLRLKIKSLEVENEIKRQKCFELEQEVNQKDTVIELLEKGEVEINGIVQTIIDNVKVRWLGWPEGGVLEEVDLTIVNNSLDTLKNIILNLLIVKEGTILAKVEEIKTKSELKPKERVNYKINLFKYLKKQGKYIVQIRTYSKELGRELNVSEKTIVL